LPLSVLSPARRVSIGAEETTVRVAERERSRGDRLQVNCNAAVVVIRRRVIVVREVVVVRGVVVIRGRIVVPRSRVVVAPCLRAVVVVHDRVVVVVASQVAGGGHHQQEEPS